MVALLAIFGWIMVPFLLIHHFYAWYGLTQANYVEHYGLLRQKLPNGRYELPEPRHSWNTNHIYSNLISFHLQRHSDHHANALRPYQALRDFDDLPRLPSGYPGSFGLAVIPPLWFKVMDPKLMRGPMAISPRSTSIPRSARSCMQSTAAPSHCEPPDVGVLRRCQEPCDALISALVGHALIRLHRGFCRAFRAEVCE